MQTYEYKMLHDWLMRVEERLDALEGNRPKAESDAAACSPDRDRLAELKLFIVKVFNEVSLEDQLERARSAKKNILLQVELLDQGPSFNTGTILAPRH